MNKLGYSALRPKQELAVKHICEEATCLHRFQLVVARVYAIVCYSGPSIFIFLSPQAVYGMDDVLNIEPRRNILQYVRFFENIGYHLLHKGQNKLVGITKFFPTFRCRRKKTSQNEQLNTRNRHSTLLFYSGDHFMAIIIMIVS